MSSVARVLLGGVMPIAVGTEVELIHYTKDRQVLPSVVRDLKTGVTYATDKVIAPSFGGGETRYGPRRDVVEGSRRQLRVASCTVVEFGDLHRDRVHFKTELLLETLVESAGFR